jgi:hypothetical protein
MGVTTGRDGNIATVIVSGSVDRRGAGDLDLALTACFIVAARESSSMSRTSSC